MRAGSEETSRAVHLQILAWVLFSVSFVTLGLRLWVHVFGVRQKRGHATPSGVCIAITLLLEFIHTVLIAVACTYGLGKHFQTLNGPDRAEAGKYIIIIQGVAVATPMMGRIAFSIFLLQLVGRLHVWQKPVLHGVIAVQLIVTFVTLAQIYSQCGKDITALWDPRDANTATCQDPIVQTIIGYVQSSVNSLCDLILTVLPGSIVWKLQQTVGKKIVLGIFLCLSIFAFAASIVKAVEIGNLASRHDTTWNFSTLSIWVLIENNIIIIVASIPTLRPLMRTSKRSTSEQNERSRGTNRGASDRINHSRTTSACHHDVPLSSMNRKEQDEDTEHILKERHEGILQKTEVRIMYADSELAMEEGSVEGARSTSTRGFP